MAVLKLCVAQGVQTFNLGLPILAEEMERSKNAAVYGPHRISLMSWGRGVEGGGVRRGG